MSLNDSGSQDIMAAAKLLAKRTHQMPGKEPSLPGPGHT